MSSEGCSDVPSSKRQQLESLEDSTNEGESKKEIILSLYFNFQLGKDEGKMILRSGSKRKGRNQNPKRAIEEQQIKPQSKNSTFLVSYSELNERKHSGHYTKPCNYIYSIYIL